MIFLLGISHNHQWDKNGADCVNFVNYLKITVPKLCIKIIAEEWSIKLFEEDVYRNIQSTSIFDLANELRIKHIYVDTDRETDKKLGIKRDGDTKRESGIRGCELCMRKEDKEKYDELCAPNHRKRERYWLTQINKVIKEEMIFVCGYHHVPHFSQLLNSNKIANKILPKTFITELPKCYLCA